jgi:HEAT repeat protein
MLTEQQMRCWPRNLGIVMGVAFLATGVFLWRSSDHRQLQKPVMDGQPIGYWLDRMGAADNREELRDRLVALGPPVTPPLLTALDDKPSPLNVKATELLIGRFPAVAQRLFRRKYSSRWMAAYALAAMPPDPKIRDALIRVLAQASHKEEDSNVGFYAVLGLRDHYTNDAPIVVPALRRALGGPHHNIQALAARALPSFGTHSYPAIPELISLTTGTDGYLAGHAAHALGDFGPIASNALPALGRLLTNAEPTVRRRAAVAMWRIDRGTGFPEDILRWNMKHASLQERWFAAQQLWELDSSRREEASQGLLAVVESPPVDDGTDEPFHGARWGAAEALGKMGADAATALPVLSAISRDDANERMRREAREACERIERAVSELQRAQENAKN